MADNEFAARKSEGAGAVEDERWRRWMQTMKKNIISKNIVCETCNAVCQRVCYHKTNFSATDINPDCRLSNIFCSVACADMGCSKMDLYVEDLDSDGQVHLTSHREDLEDEGAETQECECLRTSRDPRRWCENRALAQNKKRNLEEEARASAREFDEHGERFLGELEEQQNKKRRISRYLEDEEANMQKCECLRTSRDPRQWCEKCKREAREQEERESAKILASLLAQNKKRRINKGTSRKKEETRGEAEERIAMQLAIDESLDAEMEEEGEDDKGTIDVAGLLGWKLNEVVVREPDFILRRGFFGDHVKEDGEETGGENQYEKFLRGRDLWKEVEEVEEEEEEELEEEEEEKEVDRELGQQWFPFWSSASEWKERCDEQCKEIKAKNNCSSRQPTYNRFTDVPLTRGWWREQEKVQTRQKRENKQDEDEEEDVDCTCYEDACGWCKVCKPKEEEEEQEEEEESNLDKEYEEEMKEGQPKAKRHYGQEICKYCGNVVQKSNLSRHHKSELCRQAQKGQVTCEYCKLVVQKSNLSRHHKSELCRQAQMKAKKAEFRQLLRELRQTRFGMRLGGVQEGEAKKQEEQKERMDEWEEWDVEETVEETVEPVVYQPNCMRCDEWGVGVDCIGSGDSRRVISREIICCACGAIAPGLKQRIVTGNPARGRRARARKMRIIAKNLDEATDILDIEDIGEKYWKDLPDGVARGSILCPSTPDSDDEEAMATQEPSNQDVEFDPVEFRHQTEEWLDEVCQCF